MQMYAEGLTFLPWSRAGEGFREVMHVPVVDNTEPMGTSVPTSIIYGTHEKSQ